MTLPKLHLHIGSPKTGTTSFQHYLNGDFDRLLNDFKLYYPFCENDRLLSGGYLAPGSEHYFSIGEVRHSNGQRILASTDPFALLAEIAEIARAKSVDVVISDESLSSFSHPASPFVAELRRLFNVCPVIVIRDPLEYVYGSYLETIKLTPYTCGFDEFVRAQPGGAIQFRFYKEWCQEFSNIKVLSFKAISKDLVRNLLLSFDCSRDLVMAAAVVTSAKNNVSLNAECYEIIRRLNRAGLYVMARTFASLYEVSGVKGVRPRPNLRYREIALTLHGDLFDYLFKHIGVGLVDFMNDGCGLAPNDADGSSVECFSAESLDVLLKAVGSVYEQVEADGSRADSYADRSGLLGDQDARRRALNDSRDASPWGRFCPVDFSPIDYVEMSGVLNARPYEELRGFDPYRHYVIYGKYGGCAIKKCSSISEQLSLFSDSPFLSYVPDGFDAESYLRMNSDVHLAGVDPYHHYWAYGKIEDRFFC